ncbi:Lipid A biosynthesis palmitoleoyltransferase [bioreactor metagenome]|uniref:Lipid A biosynthesis palmitoleoyltransferase n=1 Tax=bioreactor metagenome TaxID=1076179 RepID=A0A644W6R8_9ZZZZ
MFQFCAFVFMQTLIRLMPFWLMYGLCNINGFLLQHVIRYRRKVVDRNLRNAFPEKNEKEIRKLKRQFYRYFADMLFEAGKGYKMARRNLKKRYRVTNPDLMDRYFREGESVILDMAHFNNWEWTTGVFGEVFPHKVFAIYKPMRNKRIDAFIRKSREHRNYTVVPLANTGLMFRNIQHQPCAFIMASDQSPVQLDKAYWVEFLHQTSGFLHGPEIYARKFGLAVVFTKVMKTRRGYYEITLIPISETGKDLAEGHITAHYAKLLESTIREQPPRWLWSHKRWKKKKPENKEIIKI